MHMTTLLSLLPWAEDFGVGASSLVGGTVFTRNLANTCRQTSRRDESRTMGGQNHFRHQATAQDTGHRAQARPRGVAGQPESRDANVMREGMLVAVGERQANAADGPARPPGA